MCWQNSKNMKICAIIAEFNPFHNGHRYIIEEAKRMGCTHVAAIMSGNFVQRGEPAIFSKKVRAELALKNGVDLVVEMPCVWSLSSAEKYAETGVFLADSLGSVDSLVFGSECGDLKKLSDIAQCLKREEFSNFLQNNLKSGVTFAKAREKTVAALLPDIDVSDILSKGNNILGIEYIKAIKKLNLNIRPLTLRRNLDFKSAAEVRALIKANKREYCEYMPNNTEILESPKDIFWGEKGILSILKTMSLEDFAELPDVSEGLENKICNSLSRCVSLKNLLNMIKSKRYTMSRIKRIIMCAYLGINNKTQNKYPPYIRLLGATEKGLDILNIVKRTAKLPIISRFSDLSGENDFSRKVFEIECMAADLFGVFAKKLEMCQSEKKFKFIRQE